MRIRRAIHDHRNFITNRGKVLAYMYSTWRIESEWAVINYDGNAGRGRNGNGVRKLTNDTVAHV